MTDLPDNAAPDETSSKPLGARLSFGTTQTFDKQAAMLRFYAEHAAAG